MPHRSILFLAAASIVLLGAGSAPAGPYYLTDLGALAGSTNPTSYALAVNDYGVVVGTSSTSKSSTKFTTATIYTPGSGGWTDIGSSFKGLLGITSAGTFANAINDAGQVAGYLYEATPVNNTDSFIYNTATQAYTDMAAQPGVCNGWQVQCGENMLECHCRRRTSTPAASTAAGRSSGNTPTRPASPTCSSGTAARRLRRSPPLPPPPARRWRQRDQQQRRGRGELCD